MRSFSTRIMVSVALAAGTLNAAPAAAAPGILTSLELRGQFARCGFEIGNPGAPPASQYVVLRDPGAAAVGDADDPRSASLHGADRIVMAIVYKDAATARLAHEQAHANAESRLHQHWTFNDDNGPQLLVGYGGSVWRANVAMVQSSDRMLASLYSYDSQTDATSVARPEMFNLGFVSTSTEYAVDRDFVACLDDAGLTATNPPEVPVPIFLAGQPW